MATQLLLKFGVGRENTKLAKLEAKLGKRVFAFSLPAGYTCPGASACLTRFDRKTGHIVDGPKQEFRCFAANMESAYRGFRDNTSHNFDLLKKHNTELAATDLIQSSLPPKAEIIRIHVSGDFFSESYFRAWVNVACNNPHIEFYAYTKSLPFWVAALTRNLIPSNLHLTASQGGKHDAMIDQYGLRSSKVVMSIEEASVLGLDIDHDDSHAAQEGGSFALLIHGQQKSGSTASKALRQLAV